MFSDGAPALPWDEKKQYTREHIKVYYCTYAGTILKESQLVEALQGIFPSDYVEIGIQVCAQRFSLSELCTRGRQRCSLCLRWTIVPTTLAAHWFSMNACEVLLIEMDSFFKLGLRGRA
jgi:hypothetical protein